MKRILSLYVFPLLAYLVIRLLNVTVRVTEEGREIEQNLRADGKPVIYAFWHGRMITFLTYFENRSRYKVLVSPSMDGEIIARTASLLGFGVVRGSSYKNSRTALRELKRTVEEGFSTGLIADGSRGPMQKLQPGALMLSKLTGHPVIPMTASFSRNWTAKSWDRLKIPKPFTRAVVIFGEPMTIPSDISSEEFEASRIEMENRLNEITRRADAWFDGES